MPSIAELVGEAWDPDRLALALVPFALAFTRVDSIRNALSGPGGFSVTVTLPRAVTTAWAFVNVPAEGGVNVSLPGLALVPVIAAVTAVLSAGYLARLDAGLGGFDRSFVAGIGAFVLPLFGFQVLQFGAVALLVPVALVGPAALLVLLPLFLVLAYLFYATPFLVVTEDRGLVGALARSYDLATTDGAHLSYAVQYAVVVLALSMPASLVVRNGGVAGIVGSAAVLAPVGLALDGATMLYLRRRVRGEDPTPAVRRVDGEWDY